MRASGSLRYAQLGYRVQELGHSRVRGGHDEVVHWTERGVVDDASAIDVIEYKTIIVFILSVAEGAPQVLHVTRRTVRRIGGRFHIIRMRLRASPKAYHGVDRELCHG